MAISIICTALLALGVGVFASFVVFHLKEIKAKTLVESLEISSDLLKSAGKGLCATGHTIARGIHTTIHEIINSISNLIKNAIATKVNCLMTTAILGGVCAACLIKARSFDKALVVE